MHVLHVVGARPNFVKAAPVVRALSKCDGIRQCLVHTGQHYDDGMSGLFFRQLGMPEPHVNLEVGSGSQARQTADIMSGVERVVLEREPDLVLVYGDVNSSLAAALVCAKVPIPVGHVEAGLRSFDRAMPEEINRLVIDHVSDLLFTTSADGDENLLREGIAPERIHLVGNVMIDTLVRFRTVAEEAAIRPRLGLRAGGYGLITLHRPSNVDDTAMLGSIVAAISEISRDLPLVFPVHPRTRQRLQAASAGWPASNVQVIDPLGYVEFLDLQRHAAVVMTDSGGVQEETTFLGVPCLTLRDGTERPVTVTLGTNILVGSDMEQLRAQVGRILEGELKHGRVPPLWDGHTAERIARTIVKWNGRR